MTVSGSVHSRIKTPPTGRLRMAFLACSTGWGHRSPRRSRMVSLMHRRALARALRTRSAEHPARRRSCPPNQRSCCLQIRHSDLVLDPLSARIAI
jgi:hypothetical protein